MKTSTNTTLRKDERIAGCFFISPAIIFMGLIVVYPLIYNIVMSFRDVTLMTFNGKQKFIGFDNYLAILKMPLFKKALVNTFIFTVISLLFQFIIGFALALLFSKTFALARFSRGILMVCWMIPVIVYASIWKWMFAGDGSGLINFFLTKLGIIHEPISLLTSQSGAMIALLITNIWRGVPYNMLLLATGLTTLPKDVLEAATIDGTTKWQRFIMVKVPLLRSTIISVVTLGFINTFKTFDLVWIMTKGGPLDSTQILATASYKLTFSSFEFGQGAAVADILLIILSIIGFFNLKFMYSENK